MRLIFLFLVFVASGAGCLLLFAAGMPILGAVGVLAAGIGNSALAMRIL